MLFSIQVGSMRFVCSASENDPSLGAGRALADAKRGADLCHGHVRLGSLVRQEVELAQYVDDTAGPCARLP